MSTSSLPSWIRFAERRALEVVEWLRPGCKRIEIAGSIRRQRPDVGDIEIVAIPMPGEGLFGPGPELPTVLDNLICDLLGRGAFLRREADGAKYKKLFTACLGGEVQVDLFLATPENWGYILALRTGPAGFSKRLVTPDWQGGLLRGEYMASGGHVSSMGAVVPLPEEREFFDRCVTIGWIEPEGRV